MDKLKIVAMENNVQVSPSHYGFTDYMSKGRWASLWHQVDEIQGVATDRILEIGPGRGILKAICLTYGIDLETLDFDPDLKPDYVSSVTSMPFKDDHFKVVCAFQVLEHLEFEQSCRAFAEIVRISRGKIIVSLPNARPVWRIQFPIPKIMMFDVLVEKPLWRPPEHMFDGEHYWEIGKKNYPLEKIIGNFSQFANLERHYRNKEFPYHHFFIFNK
jgi:hypothetical protein